MSNSDTSTNLETSLKMTTEMIDKVKDLIQAVPDYPKPGVDFKDITPLLASDVFPELITVFAEAIRPYKPQRIAGIESRGFILGAAIAHELKIGFVPIRKKGKLPPPVVSQHYDLEYGTDIIEVKLGSGPIIVIDDVLATGGTLNAAASVLEKAGYQVLGFFVLMNLSFLNQFEWKSLRAHSLIEI